jgi:GMP synthase (glutamine-hydrolysing)
MKKLYIIKAGSTFATVVARLGDFDKWVAEGLGEPGVEIGIVDVEHGASLPAAGECAGVVITGSHSMVTDNLPWSLELEEWIPSLLSAATPVFGICYGHQILAQAAGGKAGFHPRGREVGTVSIQLLPACSGDPLFRSLPPSFPVHASHSQTVLTLPGGATRLAANAYEPSHAFRVGDWAWGVQFHPEYSVDIMRSYITERADELESAGMDVPRLLDEVTETPVAAQTLSNFGAVVRERLGDA